MRFAQISDLHVTSNYFRKDWFENMATILDDEDPGLVVITGDLTVDGYASEFEVLATFMERISQPKLVVPGNHDAMNQGYAIFEEMFGSRKPYFENDEIAIQGLDSSQPDICEGEIGRHNYPLVMDLKEKDKLRVVALHHHSIPIPGTGREINVLYDAGDFMKTCMDAGVDLVLSGHRHLPWIWYLNGVYFITAGTACTSRLKGKSYPSLNIFDSDRGSITMRMINVATGESKTRIDSSPIRCSVGIREPV